MDLEKALRAAVQQDRSGIVEALLEAGARVDGLGPHDLMRYGGRPQNATRRMLQEAGVSFGLADGLAHMASGAGKLKGAGGGWGGQLGASWGGEAGGPPGGRRGGPRW